MKQSIESSKPYTPAYSEDTYDEINAELLELSARLAVERSNMDAPDAASAKSGLVLIGSGEDCSVVLFSQNYRVTHVQ